MTGNPPSTPPEDDEPSTRIVLRGPDGRLRLPQGVPVSRDEGSTMTQSFRVRNVRARREKQALLREENLSLPSAWVDASFPVGVAVLLSLQPVVDAVQAGAWVRAWLWLVLPACAVFAIVAPLSRQLDRAPRA